MPSVLHLKTELLTMGLDVILSIMTGLFVWPLEFETPTVTGLFVWPIEFETPIVTSEHPLLISNDKLVFNFTNFQNKP